MPADALLSLQSSVTKTDTFNSAAVILPGGTPRRGLKARIIYSALSAASGTDTVTFQIDVCRDGVPTLWNPEFLADPITMTTTAKSGEIFLPIEVSPDTVAAGIQIRLTATFSSAAHTNTCTYKGDIVLARP